MNTYSDLSHTLTHKLAACFGFPGTPVLSTLGSEPGALHMLGKCSAAELHPQPSNISKKAT